MGKGPRECARLLLQALAELVLQLGELGPGLQEEGARVRCGDLADVEARVQALADAVQHRERAHLRARMQRLFRQPSPLQRAHGSRLLPMPSSTVNERTCARMHAPPFLAVLSTAAWQGRIAEDSPIKSGRRRLSSLLSWNRLAEGDMHTHRRSAWGLRPAPQR